MKANTSSLELRTFSMTILGLCLVLAHGSSAATSSYAKPLIQFQKYDLKKTTDLKSLELQRIQVQQKMGPGSGSGGDSCALMILANTRALLSAINDKAVFGNNMEIAKKLESSILNAEVLYAPELSVEGNTVEVINYPNEHQLEVSERFCQRINDVSVSSMGLLLHEYLGLAEIEDRKFEISSGFVSELNKLDYNPRVIDGHERLDLMKGQYLEVQKDMPFHANVPTFWVYKLSAKELFRGYVMPVGPREYDRILPQGTRIKISKVELSFPKFYPKSSEPNCGNSFELELDHPEVKIIRMNHYVWARNANECYRKAEAIRVEDLYKSLGEYFVIKTVPPRVIK